MKMTIKKQADNTKAERKTVSPRWTLDFTEAKRMSLTKSIEAQNYLLM